MTIKRIDKCFICPYGEYMQADVIRQDVLKKSDVIARALEKGKDVELRKTKDGISVMELSKKTLAK